MYNGCHNDIRLSINYTNIKIHDNSLLYRNFCLCLVEPLTLRATRAPWGSRAGPPSKLRVELMKADASTLEYERHRACLSVKTSTDEAVSCTSTRTHVEGRRSVELVDLRFKPVRASRVQGFQGPYNWY